jgi:hypothetical protein
MKAVIANEVFAAADTEQTGLIRLCDVGLEGRHRIQAEDETESRFEQWMQALSRPLRDACRVAFAAGLEAEAREPSRFAIHVVAGALSDWTAQPPRLSLRDALEFLNTTFSLLVEDNVSDRAFLLAMATPEQRRWLEECEKKGWLRFENGGGVQAMRRPVLAYKKMFFPEARVFVLFDSDALRPGVPGKQSEDVRASCEEPPRLAHCQLRRRASENYLPREILRQHTERPHPKIEANKTLYVAFARLREDQRFHFNMKKGFRGDSRNIKADAGDLYAALSPEDQKTLQKGFGPDLGKLFGSVPIDEHLLQSDGGWAEMNPIVCSIIAMLR